MNDTEREATRWEAFEAIKAALDPIAGRKSPEVNAGVVDALLFTAAAIYAASFVMGRDPELFLNLAGSALDAMDRVRAAQEN